MRHLDRFAPVLGVALLLTASLTACTNESDPPTAVPGASTNVHGDSGSRLISGPVQGPIDPWPTFIPWPPDLDYQAFLDDASFTLFARDGMALTLGAAIGGEGSSASGLALFQETNGQVSTLPFTVAVGAVDFIETGIYTDEATGEQVDVETTWFDATVATALGTVDAYVSAVTATHPLLEEYYLVLIEPGPGAGRPAPVEGDGVSGRTALPGRGPTPERIASGHLADWDLLDLDVDFESGLEIEIIEGGEEDPCDKCITDHNEARDKAIKRHKRCRRKALLYGGGATIIASFGGPWGTAGGLLGTAAAVDACNDTLKDAKEDAINAYCDCWAANDCDTSNEDYQENCQ
jgi:hypothetical protein